MREQTDYIISSIKPFIESENKKLESDITFLHERMKNESTNIQNEIDYEKKTLELEMKNLDRDLRSFVDKKVEYLEDYVDEKIRYLENYVEQHVKAHIRDYSNPHNVTCSQIGAATYTQFREMMKKFKEINNFSKRSTVIDKKKFLIGVDDYFTDFKIVDGNNPEKVVVNLKEFAPRFFSNRVDNYSRLHEVELPINPGNYIILFKIRSDHGPTGFMFVQDGYYDPTKKISEQRNILIYKDQSSNCAYERDVGWGWSTISKYEKYNETFWITFYRADQAVFKGEITVF